MGEKLEKFGSEHPLLGWIVGLALTAAAVGAIILLSNIAEWIGGNL